MTKAGQNILMRVLSSAAAPGGAVCEALNLSLRPTPAIGLPPQVNGANSLPASVSIHHHNLQRSLYHPLQSPSSTVTFISTAVHNLYKNEEEFEMKVHPAIIGSMATSSDIQNYSDAVMDLACPQDKKPFTHEQISNGNHGGQVLAVSLSDSNITMVPEGASEFKSKVYPCPECLKVFRHPMSLHHHRHVHKGTYTCQSCGKVFSRRWDLHRHIHRSKMGCRRPNHTPPADAAQMMNSAVHQDHPFDLNNPPSN